MRNALHDLCLKLPSPISPDTIHAAMTLFKTRRRDRGHNLLEMMIATVIFATALISIASVYQYIAIATAKARTRLVGQYLAKGLMERCVAAKYYNVLELASVPSPTPPTGASKIPGYPTAVYPPVEMTFRKDGTAITNLYYQEVQVDDSAPMGSGGIGGPLPARLVRVKVSWEEQNRRSVDARPFAEYRAYIGQNS